MKNSSSQLNFIFFSTLIAILIWMASPSVKANAPQSPLASYSARYEISWHGIPTGESIHRLYQQKDGQYHFESQTQPKIRALPFYHFESSHFKWVDGKILPQKYTYHFREGKRRKSGKVTFNYATNKILNLALSEPWETDIPENVQDKITQGLSLRQALKAGNKNLTFTVAEEDKLKDYTFVILGEERLKTKLGLMDVIKVEHTSRKGAKTTFWLAKKLDYVPVKMTQLRKGKLVAGGQILSFTLAHP